MTAEKWQEVWAIYETVKELSVEERLPAVESASTDSEIVREVLDLLESPDEPETPSSPSPVRRAGDRIGRYELNGPLGRGGMGEVYAARDTELGRPVALKFLAPEVIGNRSVVERFIREAKAASALNHPNIVTVHEVIRSESTLAIVMELVEGTALRNLCGAPLPLDQVLHSGQQIAQALAAAHALGIVHRDVKPENIMVRRDGYIKVLDFGLARQVAVNERSSTIGLPVGTLRYMSPEQTRGEPLTGASDIFSLGLVLYELSTGEHPFAAHSAFATADAIATKEPEAPSAINALIPRKLEALILSMLAKDQGSRPAAEQVAQTLDEIRHPSQAPAAQLAPAAALPPETRIARRSPSRLIIGAAVVLLAAIAGAVAWYSTHAPSQPASPAHIGPLTSYPGEQDFATLSPDGKQVAFLWKKEEEAFHDVYVQMVGSEQPLRLTSDPANKSNPVWSPDGRYIGFLRQSRQGNEICAIPVLGGSERKLGRAQGNGYGLDWSPDGDWLAFVDTPAPGPDSIYLLSTRNGERRRLTSPSRPVVDGAPAFSPTGQYVAFVRSLDINRQDLYVMPAAGGQVRRLTTDNRRILGFAWSADSREIIFSSPRAGPPRLWRLPLGAPEKLQQVGVGNAVNPTVARQGKRLAFTEAFEDSNIWRVESPDARPSAKRSPPVKLIASTRSDHSPQFSPDGSRIVFASDRSGSTELWRCDRDGSNLVQLTNFGGRATGTPRWSPDGRQIAFDARPFGAADIFIMGAEGGPPRRLTTEPSHDLLPSWSRDGRWIYFCSDRSGDLQVWRKPAEGGQAIQVTTKGGWEAFESTDASFLYYSKRSAPGIWRVALKERAPVGEETLVPQLREAGTWRYWVVRKEGIFFVPEEHTSPHVIKFLDFRTGQVRPMAALEGDPVIGSPGLEVSPDGRWILYAQIDQKVSNIMLVEGFR